ncbi:MAG: hypothetical protein K1X28_07040 [Parachlamydiales bacterium]|nr:hypothetical protein [Parachlamydiales bacterium]
MIHFILAAALSLESAMTKEEQKETGVAKLNIQERAALRDWIEDHYTKKMVAQKSTAPILQEVLKGGRFVRLSDSSLWEIEPGDTPITQSWITPTEIKIGQSTDTQYPYTLTNHLTGSTVKARKAQKVTP